MIYLFLLDKTYQLERKNELYYDNYQDYYYYYFLDVNAKAGLQKKVRSQFNNNSVR